MREFLPSKKLDTYISMDGWTIKKTANGSWMVQDDHCNVLGFCQRYEEAYRTAQGERPRISKQPSIE